MKPALLLLLSTFFINCGYAQSTVPTDTASVLFKKFFDTPDITARERIYIKLQAIAPEGSATARGVNYDEFRRILTMNYLHQDSIVKYEYYVNAIKDKVMMADQLYKMLKSLTVDKRAATFAHRPGATLLKLSNDIKMQPALYKPAGVIDAEWLRQVEQNDVDYKIRYALVLYREEKYNEAKALLKPLYEKLPALNSEVADLYAKVLSKLGENKRSAEVADEVFKAGYRSDELMAMLKTNYVALHGNDTGYEKYLSEIQKSLKLNVRKRLRSQMISKPAVPFSLKDANGRMVSLHSLAGKVVIVDFWATWCAPCIASFPAAQRAINKFKGDQDVQFLFLDTWENDPDFKAKAIKLINDSKYTFKILFDEKNTENGKQELTANYYQVTGIPTRLVIDKKGKVCFWEAGYSGSTDQMAEDLITMVELAKER